MSSPRFRLRDFIANHMPPFFRRRSSTYRQRLRLTASSTMDRLPNELLAYIFATVMDDLTEDPLFAVTLSHVSARWRDLAISTGNLWTRITVTFPLSEKKRTQMETLLTRSATYPLNISIDVRDPDWDWNEDTHHATWQAMVPFIRLLVAHVGRWREFEMLSDTWVPIFTFLFYTKAVSSAPLLEVLSLSRCNAYLAIRGQTFQPAVLREPLPLLGGGFSAVERLRHVTLVGVHIDWNDTVLRNLTRLEFKYHSSDVMPSPEAFRTILVACPGLVDFSIVGWGPILDRSVKYPDGVFHLPALKNFTFGFVDTAYAIQLLSMFHMPNLRMLTLEDVNKLISPTGIQIITPLLEWFISRCGSTSSSTTPSIIPIPLHRLTSLELTGLSALHSPFSDFFSQLLSLKRLTCVDMHPYALEALIARNQNISHYVCPSLRELRCVDMDPEKLIQVVSARRRLGPAGALQKVSIEFARERGPPPGSLPYHRLVNEGIEVLRSDSDSDLME